MSTIIKPMLACDAPPLPELFTTPRKWIVQPKLDGIRCLIYNGPAGIVLYSRTGKEIPNEWIQNYFLEFARWCELMKFIPDGELVLPGGNRFDEVQSTVMSRWKECPSISYRVFDTVDSTLSTVGRMLLVDSTLHGCKFKGVHTIPTTYVDNEAGLLTLHEQYMFEGYEGSIIRRLAAKYKHGRSTQRERSLMRLVDWKRDEAILIDCTEKMYNFDTSCTKKENLSPANTLGAMVVRHHTYGTFSIGTGFTDAQRHTYWNRWNNHTLRPGTSVTFKFKPSHMKDKPQGVFVGIRLEETK